MNILDEIRDLESKGVFIHLSYDHYKDGTNCNFSIEFVDYDQMQTKHKNQTSWFGDNHEYGDTADVIVAAIGFAKWLLEGDNSKWYFFNVNETITEEGKANWRKTNEIRALGHDLIPKQVKIK